MNVMYKYLSFVTCSGIIQNIPFLISIGKVKNVIPVKAASPVAYEKRKKGQSISILK